MDSQNSYMISLDAIDMNLLPIINQRDFNNIIPLWRNRTQRDKEYFKFEIKEEKSHSAENKEYTMCYICNLEIPRIFITDHKKSKKHLVHQQIAITASERLKRYLQTHEDIVQTGFDRSNNKEIYFCPECAVIVNLKDRKAHESLESHKHSVIVEKLLENLHCLYSNDKNGDEDFDASVDCNENNIETVDTGEDRFDINDEYTYLDSSSRCKEDSEYGVDIKNKDVESNKDITKAHDDNNNLIDSEKLIFNTQELKRYIDDLNNTNVQIIDENYLEIAINDAKVVVKHENYLGIKHLKDDIFVCVICCFSIHDKSGMRRHLVSDNHLKAMGIAKMDDNCLRQISSVLLHCVICNKNDYLSSIHINSIIHQNLLQTALNFNFAYNEEGLNQCDNNTIKNEISDEHTKRETSIEEDCNIESSNDQVDKRVDEKIKSVKSVRKNKYLIKVKKDKYESDDNDVNSADSKLMSSESFVAKQKHHFCTACNIEVYTNIQSHVTCIRHVMNRKSKYHYMMIEVDKKLFCKICHVYIPDNAESVQEHCEFEDHLSNYNYVLNINKIVFKDDTFQCSICKSEFSLKHELMHIEGKKHRHLKNVSMSSTKDGHYCYICDISTSNNDVDIQKHLKSISHTKKVESKHSLQPLDFVKCKVCNVEVFNSVRGRLEHRRDIGHQMNYRKKLADDKVFWRQNRYYCFACTTYIEGQALNHIEEQNHKSCSNDLDAKMNGFANSCKTM